ncbi:MAG: ABC transporter substrate-binding protein [Deltaproteobacteria bacterium]
MNRRILTILLTLLMLFSTGLNARPDDTPERIVSLSPNLTHIIYALGELDKVVGVTIYSDFPPEAYKLPKVGGWVNPSFEAIVALKPDLVMLMRDQDTIFGKKIRDLGLKTLVTDSNNSVDDILKTITNLGGVLGKEEKAASVTSDIETRLNEIGNNTRNLPRKSILLVVGRNPGTLEDIYVIGRNNYINELIELAGGENVVQNTRLSIKITKEAILTFDPDVIIEINHEQLDREKEILDTWSELRQSRAVQNGQVYILPSTVLLHPSQTIVQGAEVLTRILHPETVEKYGNNN